MNGGTMNTTEHSGQRAVLAELLDARWTCRQFRPDQVPHQDIEQLLELAQRTPSWCNTQPWQVAITEGAGTDRFRKALLEHIYSGAAIAPDFDFPARYVGEFQKRRRECGFQLYDSIGIVKGDVARTAAQMMRNFELFDAPHVAIITTEQDLGTYGAVDCGLYIGSFLLGAQSVGIATAPQAALATYAPFLHEYFGIPEHRRVVAGISFGYADAEHPINTFRTSREPIENVVTWSTD